MTEIRVVSTVRLVKGILDLLGRGWWIDRIHEDRPGRFMIEAVERPK